MKTSSKVVAMAALVFVPSVAFADFRNKHSDHCSDGRSHYNNSYYYNNGYNSWSYNPRPYPRPRDYNSHGYHAYNSSGSGYGYGYDGAIRNGIRNGQLSNAEVRELSDDLRDIHRKEVRYGSDGYISPRERDAIREEYDDFRHDLNHELRDGERRW